jgi:hypothetical protein
MPIFSISTAQATQMAAPFDIIASFIHSMSPLDDLTKSFILRYLIKTASCGTRPRRSRLKHNPLFKLAFMCSLLTIALAATDCQILNSGIPVISPTACCTETGITCLNGRVTEMYGICCINLLLANYQE